MLDENKRSQLQALFNAMPLATLEKLHLALRAEVEAGGDSFGTVGPELVEMLAHALQASAQASASEPLAAEAVDPPLPEASPIEVTLSPTPIAPAPPEVGAEQGDWSLVEMGVPAPSEQAPDSDPDSDPDPDLEPEPALGVVPEPEPESAPEREPEPEPIIPMPLGETMLRPRNSMHAFFGPLEGLITDPVYYVPRQEGALASTSLPAIWRLLNEEIGIANIRDSWARYERATQSGDETALVTLFSNLHQPAERVIKTLARKAGKEPGYRRALIMQLGGEAIYGDLLELGLMLPHAEELGRLYRAIISSRPGPRQIDQIAAHLVQYADHSIGRLKYGFFLFLAKLWNPADAVRLQLSFNDQRARAEKPPTPEMEDLVIDNVVSRMDRMNLWLDRQTSIDGMDDAVIRVFGRFADCCFDIGALDAKNLPVELTDMVRNYTRTSQTYFDRMLEQAQQCLREALPASPQDIGSDPGADLLMERATIAMGFLGSNDRRAVLFSRAEAYRGARDQCAQTLMETVAALEALVEQGLKGAEETANQTNGQTGELDNMIEVQKLVEQLSALAEGLQKPSEARETVARLTALLKAA